MTGDPMKIPEPQKPPVSFLDNLKAALPKNWQQIASALIVALLSGILAKYGLPLVVPVEPIPVPVWDHKAEEWIVPHEAANGVEWSRIKPGRCDKCRCCESCQCQKTGDKTEK